MLIGVQKVLKDTAATIVSYPRIRVERGWLRRAPSACTAKVVTPAVTETAFASCTVQAWATTLSAAASAGDDEITCAAQDGFVSGRRYLINVEGDDDIEVECLSKTEGAGTAASATLLFDENAVGSDFHSEWFTLTDVDGQSITFEWRTSGSPTAGRTAINVNAGDDAQTVANATATAINNVGATLGITCGAASLGTGVYEVDATQDDVGDAGNTAIASGTSMILGVAAFTGGVDAGPTTIVLAQGLPRDIPSGAAIRSWACLESITADQTATVGNGVVRFRATIDGSTYDWDQEFRILHRIPVSTLTATRLTQAYPIIEGLRPQADVNFEETMQLAWEHLVLPWLEISGVQEDWVQSTEALEPIHALACVLLRARPNPSFPRETLATLDAQWTQLSQNTMSRTGWWANPAPEKPAPTPEGGDPVLNFQMVMR